MSKRNNSIKKLISFTTALLSLPIISFAIESSPILEKITKTATGVSAELAFWSPKNTNADISRIISGEINPNSNSIIFDNSTYSETELPLVSSGSIWAIDMAPEEIETPSDDGDNSDSNQISDMLEALPYPDSIENKSGQIKQVNYNIAKGKQYFNLESDGLVRNVTSLSNDTLLKESKKLPEFKIDDSDEPQVLIMHTHTTESYEPYERDFFDKSFTSRTTDESKNVVAVGEAIAKELKSAGIGVIHDKTLHDYPNYNGSYERSAVTVKQILKDNPSIKIVLDVHRDAIQSNGVRNAPVTEIDGKKAAQIMIISGCDDGTMNMPNYLQNFRLSSLLQQEMESAYPGLTRPILFDYRKYNQDLTTGSILLEMGSHANSIDQAIYSGELLGKSLASGLEKLK